MTCAPRPRLALRRDAGADHLAQAVRVERLQTEPGLEPRAQRRRPHLAAEQAHLERRLAEHVGELGGERRRAAQHLCAEVADQRRLQLQRRARGGHDRCAEPLGALLEAEPAGREPVRVGVVHDHPGAHAGARERPCHQLGPHVEVAARVPDQRRPAARPRRGVQPHELVRRDGHHPERVAGAQVLLDGEGDEAQVVERLDGDGDFTTSKRRAQPPQLQFMERLARRRLDGAAGNLGKGRCHAGTFDGPALHGHQ